MMSGIVEVTLRRFSLLSIFLWLFTFLNSASASTLTISNLRPPPNYSLSTDSQDKLQLTDGKIENYPIWLSRDSVGWQYQTPVRIDIALLKPINSGTLKLHTACGTHAGVFFPRRIDIYTRRSDGDWQYINTATTSTEENCRRAIWLSAEVKNINLNIALIVHANGTFIFFDEIELTPSDDRAPLPPNPISIQNITAGSQQKDATNSVMTMEKDDLSIVKDNFLIQDSLNRLRSSLSIRDDNYVSNNFSENPNILNVWRQDPWLSAEKWGQPASNTQVAAIELSGTDREIARFCLGILASTSAPISVAVKIEDESLEKAIRIRQLMPVLAASGIKVYDRLQATSQGSIDVNAKEPAYAWVDVDLSKLGAGKHSFTVTIQDRDKKFPPVTTSLNVNVVHDSTAPAPLNIITWSYIDRSPIWNDSSSALSELFSAGTNVFVIHPSIIPGLLLNGSWKESQEKEFDRQVKLLSPHGQILLVFGWTKNNNPFANAGNDSSKLERTKKSYQDWLLQITEHMNALGLSKKQWAIYPIDEPHDEDLELLSRITNYTKEADASIRIYANPIPSDSPTKQIQLLTTALATDITLWQPKLELANSAWGYWFRQLKQPMWIYAVPPAPAKTAEPLAFYRAIPWNAWRLGATGIGFWAFSDTNGSSARDDLDGQFPDWAVVYEGVDGQQIESSRRWEAFKQGIQDYKLFAAADLSRTVIENPSSYDSAKMDALRLTALNVLQQHTLPARP